MAQPKILLVDGQTEALKLALKTLAPHPYDVRSAADGAEAFLMKLRGTPKLALVPVIFLTSRSGADDRIRGFRLGADEHLDKSTEFWELPDRAARALTRGRELEASMAPSAPSAGLAGRCDVIGLASLFAVLESSQRSGILRLKRARPEEEGLVYLVGGRVRRAELAPGLARNREAVYAMMTWTDGGFDFAPSALRVADDVESSTAQLLVEAARRFDAVR